MFSRKCLAIRSFHIVCLLLMVPGIVAGRGSHFLVEPFTGVTFNQGFGLEDAVGLESGFLVGVGGKFKGFPPRFYLYLRVAESLFGEDEISVSVRNATASVRRSFTQVSGGIRAVFPLFSNFRLNLEVGGGSLFSSNSYSESGRQLTAYDEDLTVFEMGAGLNFRLFEWLSLGVMYNYSYAAENHRGDLIATILKEDNRGAELGWSHLTATVGFHF